MAKKKGATYVALTGIDFENLTPAIRVEAGEPIPDRVGPDAIKDLLEAGLIKESEGEK